MKYVKTVAVCAVVALGIGATSATAGSLIGSAKIKDGTIQMRDLSPSLQAKIKQARASQAGTPGPKGDTAANGANGAKGETGQAGANGRDGRDGKDGRDGVRFDRVVGSCDTSVQGEVSIANGVARLGVPENGSWAQVRSYPKNLTVSQLNELSFSANASDEGVVYLKVTTTGHGSIVFSPNTQPGGEQTGESVKHDVLAGTARWNDDAGKDADLTWEQILEKAGNEYVKTVGVIAGCAQPVGDDGGVVEVDDLTVNDEVIDFQ